MNRSRRLSWLIPLCALLLAGCGGGMVRRVSPPAASIQQLTVHADGSWTVDLRLQNYSSIPMRFDQVDLQVAVADQVAGRLQGAPQLWIGPTSADVVSLQLRPQPLARIAVADALAGRRSLPYRLEGHVAAMPDEGSKAREYEIDGRSALNPAPGLDGVLR